MCILRMHAFLLFVAILNNYHVFAQQYISITVPTSIYYKVDRLWFKCTPRDVPPGSSISEIKLSKDSSSGYQEVVKVFVDTSTGSVVNKVLWHKTDTKNRVNAINMTVSPTNQARLEFDINAANVLRSDEGTYKCSIYGNTGDGQSVESDAESSVVVKDHHMFPQQYISISLPTTVEYKVDKLKFKCSPTNITSNASITEIKLSKNSSSGYQEVVKVFLDTSTGTVVNKVTWSNIATQNRATIIDMIASPTNQARMEFDINATQVLCSDKGTYRCSINGNTVTGESISSDAIASISLKADFTSINDIRVHPIAPNGSYTPHTTVQLNCTGTVGNPPKDIRWCYRRSGIDSNLIDYPTTRDIIQGPAFPDDCQYTRTSSLLYNVSASYHTVEIQCETGGSNDACGSNNASTTMYTILSDIDLRSGSTRLYVRFDVMFSMIFILLRVINVM